MLYLARPAQEDISTWTPIAQPIAQRPGRFDIPPFTAAENRTFQLFLEGTAKSKVCPDAAIDWTIHRNGKPSTADSTKVLEPAFFSGESIACRLGEFDAQKGQQYAVVLNIQQIATQPALANPKLLIQTYPNAWLDAYVGKAFYRALATNASILLALLATLLLATSLIAPNTRHPSTRQNAAPPPRPSSHS